MLKTIAPSEMKRVELSVMAQTSITGEALMQRASEHVADAVWKYAQHRPGMVLCLCGCGNNGGDGLAAMRILAQRHEDFCGLCLLLPGELSPDAQREWNKLKDAAGSRVTVRRITEADGADVSIRPSCVVDALFGTGLSRGLDGLALAACRWMNQLADKGVPVVAVDIPSGLNGLSGEVGTEAVHAAETITFHRPKTGLYLGLGPDYTGEIRVGDIGLPKSFDDAGGMDVMEEKDLSVLLPKRRKVSHKGSYGRVLLWAGSRGMAGAAAISAMAALRSGAGLVTVACPDAVVDAVQMLCPCATCLPLPQNADEAWPLLQNAMERADAFGAGCGLGQKEQTAKLFDSVAEWLSKHDMPCVLDADALNLLARRKQSISLPHAVLTPHPAEAGRLLGQSIPQVLADVACAANQLYECFGASVVLKGTCSLLCTQDGYAINPFGTPGMAKGGSGDALTGIMTALLAGCSAGAYSLNQLQLLQTACALHGLAGEKAAKQFGERGMLATDLCAFLGTVGTEKQPDPLQTKDHWPEILTVIIEHPLGSCDEETRMRYPVNAGYVQQVLEKENRWQDACVLGIEESLEWFEGALKAKADLGDREIWVVAEKTVRISEQEVRQTLSFAGEVHRIEMF